MAGGAVAVGLSLLLGASSLPVPAPHPSLPPRATPPLPLPRASTRSSRCPGSARRLRLDQGRRGAHSGRRRRRPGTGGPARGTGLSPGLREPRHSSTRGRPGGTAGRAERRVRVGLGPAPGRRSAGAARRSAGHGAGPGAPSADPAAAAPRRPSRASPRRAQAALACRGGGPRPRGAAAAIGVGV